LVAALRGLAASCAQGETSITIDAPERLPPLPAAVEVAAYRIAQEALTNLMRHAHASNCAVNLTLDDSLHLQILDDGCGLPLDRRSGIGLRSMRERAEELGGECVIEPVPKGGTCVRATLPFDRAQANRPSSSQVAREGEADGD
jgi:signal transduction histidine kinase